jgi:type IV secretion system protein VirD4
MDNLGGPGPEALLLGYAERSVQHAGAEAPLASGPAVATADGAVTYCGDSHLLTIAPNRSSRSQYCLIPNLLSYPGAMVVVDLGGEAYAATAEARRRMGHVVVRLDPFGVAGPGSDALDPIDFLDGLAEPALTSACQDIAFSSDDPAYDLAVVLDTNGKEIPKLAYSEISAFLHREERSRSRTLARLTSQLTTLGNPQVKQSLKNSTVPLLEITSGRMVTVYIILPAERLALHSALFRIWIGTLLLGASRVRQSSSPPMIFLLDHCAELGMFPLLDSLLRISVGPAFRIWTFWHDVHQLRTTYPSSWPAIVSGCAAVQIFGTKDSAAAAEAEALLGLPANDVWSLGSGEQIVALDGVPRRIRKVTPETALTRNR